MSPKIRIPLGVSDRLPERTRSLRAGVEAIARAFELAGYDPVDTPPFELEEVLEDGLGDGAKRSLFRMVDPATGEIVVLRPDFTAQVARLVTMRMAERTRPVRLCYQGRVLRAADPDRRGLQSREVFQAGAELIGAAGRWADLEVLALGARALAFTHQPLVIDLGHAAVAQSLAPPGVDPDVVHAALAAKDRATLERVAPVMAPLADLFGGREVLERARRELTAAPDSALAAIDELDALGNALAERLPDVSISYDLGEQRGLGYYTGFFFHGYLPGASDAVLMGGRYDGLLAKYGPSEPAVGLAIDADAVARGRAVPRHGVVLSEPEPERPRLLAEADRRRAAGERAVHVRADLAERYARANGYRAIVSVTDSGALSEVPVAADPDR